MPDMAGLAVGSTRFPMTHSGPAAKSGREVDTALFELANPDSG